MFTHQRKKRKKFTVTSLNVNMSINNPDENQLQEVGKAAKALVTTMTLGKQLTKKKVRKFEQTVENYAELLMRKDNPKSTYKKTALIAARKNHPEVIKFLCEDKDDLNIQDGCGRTPVYIATQNNHAQTIKILAKSHADLNIPKKNGSTPLHSAIRRSHFEATKILMKYGAQLQSKDASGRTPLDYASKEMRPFVLFQQKLILEKEAKSSKQEITHKRKR